MEKVTFQTLEELEKSHIQRVLEATKGHITDSAKILGVDRRTLYRKISKFKLKVDRSVSC